MSTIDKKQLSKIDNACKNFKEAFDSKTKKFSKLDNWLNKESTFFKDESVGAKEKKLRYKRGQVIKVDFGVNVGSELSNTHFAIVLNKDENISTDSITVLPLTSKKRYKTLNLGKIIANISEYDKYKKTTYACITQIKTISKKRILLNNKRGVCDGKILEKVDKAIINYLTNQEV